MEPKAKKNAWKTLVQFIKFNIVGVMNTLVDFVVFQLLNLLVGWTYLAQIISYTCGIVNSYIFNSSWTFKEERTRSFKEMALFLAVNLCSLSVSLGVIWLCKNALGVTDEWVASWMPALFGGFIKGDTVCKLIATLCAIVVNYAGNKLFVFQGKNKTPEASEREG